MFAQQLGNKSDEVRIATINATLPKLRAAPPRDRPFFHEKVRDIIAANSNLVRTLLKNLFNYLAKSTRVIH
jgi:hypothetical protein